MRSHPTAPSSPTRRLCSGGGGGDCDEDGGGGGHYFFSAPASPVHYILRSPPSSTAASVSASAHYAPAEGGDFEFSARQHGAGAGAAMSSAEELFLAGRIRVGCLPPICQETAYGEQEEDDEEEGGESGVDGHTPRLAKNVEPSDSFASASSSSSAKDTRRRMSLRDLLGRTARDPAAAEAVAGAERSGFWPPSIWPSRPKKALPCPAPQPGRWSTSSDRAAPAKRAQGGAAREEAPRRRTTSLPYRQGLVLGCLGFRARSYGLAKSMHPLSSR